LLVVALGGTVCDKRGQKLLFARVLSDGTQEGGGAMGFELSFTMGGGGGGNGVRGCERVAI
jgi:hypothetical protein